MTYFQVNGGINFNVWQYRQQSNYTYSHQSGHHWHNVRGYLQRPLPRIESMMLLGQLVTQAKFFSGLNFNGINLASDERTLPDSQRGYAPVIEGVANTTATVIIKQNGNQIYQRTVPPGFFTINDLYPTSYNGDLEVEINEADGSVRQFSVPFSAVPESLRLGSYRYNFSLGRTRNTGIHSIFGDMIYQYGLTNSLSLNSGVRIADKYYAATAGGVYGNQLGALGFNVNYANTTRAGGVNTNETDRFQGWRFTVSYSRTFTNTKTTISLAGYRYSTGSYLELVDALGRRQEADWNGFSQSSSYRQRNRFELIMNQQLDRFGNAFISGSHYSYRDNLPASRQLQLGYNKAFENGLSMNFVIAKQQFIGSTSQQIKKDTFASFSFSLPLGSRYSRYTPTLNSTYTQNQHTNNQYQMMVSGMADKEQTISYNIGSSYTGHGNAYVVNGGIHKHFPVANVGLNASKAKHYWQMGANTQGALALHQGGITFGPYLGDTFALVEAKGAVGAKVRNTHGSTIDYNGYALVPFITPYRYNKIILDPEGIPHNIELHQSEKQIAPYAGAAVKVNFKTRYGHALLIKVHLATDVHLPIGTEVFDMKGKRVGLVGQNNHVYLRTEHHSGMLVLKWGNTPADQCYLKYHFPRQNFDQRPMTKLDTMCLIR